MTPDLDSWNSFSTREEERIEIPETEHGRSISEFAYQRRPGLNDVCVGMSVRLENVLNRQKIIIFGDLHGMNYWEIRKFKNCGRKTTNELRTLVMQLISSPDKVAPVNETVVWPPSDQSFVATLDLMVDTLSPRSKDIVLRRFGLGIRAIRVAEEIGISRERVRQIEEKFVAKVERVFSPAGLMIDSATKEDVVEFDKLSSTQTLPAYPNRFYVAIARTLVIGGASYVDTEQFYSSVLKEFVDELKHDDDFVAGRLTLLQLYELACSCAPPLRELQKEDLSNRLQAATSLKVVGDAVIGVKPATGRIISALLRGASGPISIAVLLRQIEMKMALYGETSYFDPPRLRERLARMQGVYLLDQNTVSLRLNDPGDAASWREKAVARIVSSKRPTSLVFFIREHPDCPFDVYALASLLKDDERIVLVGRRLYASASFETERSLHVARLMNDALITSGRPMTKRELLTHVRGHRDLVCGQMENYFSRIKDLRLYTDDIVGIAPLDKTMMLLMLRSEGCVISLMRRAESDRLVQLETIWLPDDGGPDLLPAELRNLAEAARKWKHLSVELRGGSLFYKEKES